MANPYLKEDKSYWGKAMDLLTTPASMVAGGVRAGQEGRSIGPALWENLTQQRKDTFDDVLDNTGMEEGWGRTALGLGLDIGLDPTTYIPGGVIAKGLGKTAKLTGATKLAKKVGDLRFGSGTTLADSIGKRFIPHYEARLGAESIEAMNALRKAKGLPEDITEESFRDSLRLLQNRVHSTQNAGIEISDRLRKGLTPEQQRAVVWSRQMGSLPHGMDPAILQQPGVQNALSSTKSVLGQQHIDEVQARVMSKRAKEDYWPLWTEHPDPVVQRKLRAWVAKNPANKAQNIDIAQWEKITGRPADMFTMLGSRLAGGNKAIEMANFFKETAQQFGALNAVPGFRRVNIAGESPIKSWVNKFHFPEEVAGELERLHVAFEQPDAIDGVFKTMTALWKGYATRVNPGFHVRNAFTNLINSWLGGMDAHAMPLRYAEAGQKVLPNLVDPRTKAIVASGPQLATYIERLGVVHGQTGAFDEFMRATDKLNQTANKSLAGKAAFNLNPLNTQNIALRTGAKVGGKVEDLARKALFLDQMHKMAPAIANGILTPDMAAQKAALHVKKYLFDYAELTPFEANTLRNIVPFYTWVRKNLPLQLEHLVTTPGKMAGIAKTEQAVEGLAENRGIRVPTAERPDFIQQTDMVQLPFLKDGKALFMNPNLPMADLNRLPGAKGSLGGAIASLNPAIRAAIETWSNREAFSDRTIYPEKIGWSGHVKASPLAEALARVAPDLAESLGVQEKAKGGFVQPAWQRYLTGQVPALGTLGRTATGAVDLLGEGKLPFQWSNLAGVPVKAYSPEELKKDQAFRIRDEKAKQSAKKREQAGVKKSRVNDLYAMAQSMF